MRVSEIMHTPAVSCRPAATLQEVAQIMKTREVGSVIVVDNIGYVSGIVTDRDVALRGVACGHSADIAVELIMTRDVATIGPMADVAEAAARMQKRRAVRRLPVIDNMGVLHGLIAMDDLFRHLSHEADTLTDALLAQALQLDSTS